MKVEVWGVRWEPVRPQMRSHLPISTLFLYIPTSKMPREKGKEWNHVTLVEVKDRTHQHKLECKYCKHVFVECTSRIREHFLHINPTCGVAKCIADGAVLQRVLDEMGAIDAQNKAAVEQLQLDRSTAANATTSSAPAKKQRTLAVSKGEVSRLG